MPLLSLSCTSVLEEDSDGDSSWRTIRDEHASVDFDLRDINGDKILLRAKAISQLGETFNVDSDFGTREGDMRYTGTESNLGPRSFVFGFAKLLNGGQCEVDFRAEGLYLPIISNALSTKSAVCELLVVWGFAFSPCCFCHLPSSSCVGSFTFTACSRFLCFRLLWSSLCLGLVCH